MNNILLAKKNLKPPELRRSLSKKDGLLHNTRYQ